MQSLLLSSAADRGGNVRFSKARVIGASTIGALAILAATGAMAISTAPPTALAPPAVAAARATAIPYEAPSAAETVQTAASDPSVRRFSGRVGADLSQSLISAGVPQAQAREYVALLARAIDLANGLSVDDRYDLIVERRSDGSFGQLLYAGMDRVARADVELMKWTDGRQVIWVNADGVGGSGSEAMRMPVNGRLTSSFGERFHPILGYQRFHAGVDLGAAAGTPIVAAADGKVVRAGWAGGYGRAVEIAHSGGIETKYGHMSRIAAFVGEAVQRGEVIGYVGSSGLSTGPHLHFEVMKNGRPVNPLSIKAIGGAPGQLDGAKLAAFQNQLRSLLLAQQ